MSKIQAFFSADGRRLFESEKPAVEAFNHKYARALSAAILPQQRNERSNPMTVMVTTVRRVTNGQLVDDKDGRTSQSVSAKSRTMKRQNLATMVTKRQISPKAR